MPQPSDHSTACPACAVSAEPGASQRDPRRFHNPLPTASASNRPPRPHRPRPAAWPPCAKVSQRPCWCAHNAQQQRRRAADAEANGSASTPPCCWTELQRPSHADHEGSVSSDQLACKPSKRCTHGVGQHHSSSNCCSSRLSTTSHQRGIQPQNTCQQRTAPVRPKADEPQLIDEHQRLCRCSHNPAMANTTLTSAAPAPCRTRAYPTRPTKTQQRPQHQLGTRQLRPSTTHDGLGALAVAWPLQAVTPKLGPVPTTVGNRFFRNVHAAPSFCRR